MTEHEPWSYHIADLGFMYPKDQVDALDRLGIEGWELVTVVRGVFYFKRPFKRPSTPAKE